MRFSRRVNSRVLINNHRSGPRVQSCLSAQRFRRSAASGARINIPITSIEARRSSVCSAVLGGSTAPGDPSLHNGCHVDDGKPRDLANNDRLSIGSPVWVEIIRFAVRHLDHRTAGDRFQTECIVR